MEGMNVIHWLDLKHLEGAYHIHSIQRLLFNDLWVCCRLGDKPLGRRVCGCGYMY